MITFDKRIIVEIFNEDNMAQRHFVKKSKTKATNYFSRKKKGRSRIPTRFGRYALRCSKMLLGRSLGAIILKVMVQIYVSGPGWYQPENQKVVGLIPSQDTCLGYRPGPSFGGCKRQPVCVFLHLSPSLPLIKKT